MKKLFGVLLFLLCTLGGVVANASTVTVQFTGIGSSVPYHGVYAGYYDVKIDGVNATVMCDDFTATIHVGDTWVANVFTYADVLGGASTKFSGTVKYSQIGWLYGQTASATPTVRAQIAGAIWNIMTPGSVVMDPLAQSYYNQATSGTYDTFNWSNVMNVLTPTPFSAGQEFLTPTPVPVPANVLLLGSGMFGLVGFARRKRK